MILLDTNVLSELMKAEPAERVLRWSTTQSAASLYTTSITQAEILHGVMLLPTGRKRNTIEAAAKAMFEEDFSGRILPSVATRPSLMRKSPPRDARPDSRFLISTRRSPQ